MQIHRSKQLTLAWTAMVICVACLWPGRARSAPAAKVGPGSVYVVPIDETIERGLAAFLARALRAAKSEGAGLVILEINTPGGRVDAALAMRDALIDSPVPTLAYVRHQAYSAGALIAIATNEIWMSPGAVMGAATPVGGGGEKASEKVVAAVASAFAATAETRGRDPRIARAMVDEDLEVKGLVEKGKLLSLTAREALEHGYAEGEASSLAALLEQKQLAARKIVKLEPSLAEHVARFFTHPLVAPLLMSLGMLGLLFELKTPGWGLGGTVALVCLALFFWGHTVAGLAGLEAVLLLIIGLVLVALEIFVIPGFGVAGVLGFLAFAAGLFLALVGDFKFVTGQRLVEAGAMLGASFVIALGGLWAMLKYLPRAHRLSGLVLLDRLDPVTRPIAQTDTAEEPPSLLGAQGTALTDLRPAGLARFADRRVDVVTLGDYIPQGTPVEVVEDTSYRRVVRAIKSAEAGES